MWVRCVSGVCERVCGGSVAREGERVEWEKCDVMSPPLEPEPARGPLVARAVEAGGAAIAVCRAALKGESRLRP